MGMLVCQIVYRIVLRSNEFGGVSGRKEGINTESTEMEEHREHGETTARKGTASTWAGRAGQGPDKGRGQEQNPQRTLGRRLVRSVAELLELLLNVGFEPVAKGVG
jgi:hypothetical protein